MQTQRRMGERTVCALLVKHVPWKRAACDYSFTTVFIVADKST